MSHSDFQGSRRIRLLGLSNGHMRSMSGVPGFVFDALERSFADVELVDYSAQGIVRLALAAATVGPDRARWVGRFHAGRAAHRARTLILRRLTKNLDGYDVALQIHGWVHGQPRPFTLFADQTRLMAERGWPSWMPLPLRDRRWLLDAETAMYDSAAHVFAMGRPTRESLLTDYHLDPSRVTVVGGGLNLAELPHPRPMPSERSIVFVGRDFERKGGELLLRAFARVRTSIPTATLHIAGPRHRISRAGVVSHGPLGRTELAALYGHARVFCMPSLYEPYGLVFAEAMAYGIPCVGSTSQSIPEILGYGEAGLIPPAGDECALADALIQLLRDDGLATELGLAGRQLVERVHTWDHVAERMKPELVAVSQRGVPGAE